MASSKKKYKIRPLPVLMLLTVIIALCILLTILVTNKVAGTPKPVVADPSSSEDVLSGTESDTSEPVPEPASLRIIGVGDNLIHEGIYNQAQARAGGQGYDFALAYENMRALIQTADIASINQETVMVKENALSGYPQFNSPTELGDYLVDLGFDVFNLATNHTIDQATSALGGEASLLSYLNFWGTHPEVKTVGLYRNQADFENIRTIEKNGMTVAFVGMTEMTNGLSMPANTEIILMQTADEELLRTRIEKAKEIADVVVVNVHWGIEYSNSADQTQIDLAQKMVDWGADIILGHHPHVLEPVEYLTRADGSRAIVAYSLGNFISAQDTGYRMIGGALDVTVEKDFSTNQVTITEARLIPIITQYESGYKNIRNYIYDQYSDDLAASHGVRSGKTPEFSMEFIDKVISEAGIGEEFLSPWH